MQSINPNPPLPAGQDNSDEFDRILLKRRIINGSNWFYWIAALSLVNTVIALAGGNWSFGLGMAITQVIDALAGNVGGAAKVVAFPLDLLCIGIFALFGYLGGRLQVWAILVGTILYVLDLLLLIGIIVTTGTPLIIGLLIHGFATYQMVMAYSAGRKLMSLPYVQAPPAPTAYSELRPPQG